VHIDGGGHAYFRKPACAPVFDLARSIAMNYEEYAGKIRFADEDVMDIVMTKLDLKPIPHVEFWSRYCSGERRSVEIDAASGHCKLTLAVNKEIQFPYMMHFAANEASFVYLLQLRGLFRKFGVATRGLLWRTIVDFYTRHILWPTKGNLKNALNKIASLPVSRVLS
jgi:hypothetical protein